MKTILAILFSFLAFLIGWFTIGAILYLIAGIAGAAREGLGPSHLINVLLMGVLGPGIGAFFAIYVPSILFKAIDRKTLFVSFVSINVFVFVLLLVKGISLRSIDAAGIGRTVARIIQGAAVFAGAYVGKVIAEEALDEVKADGAD